MSSPPSSSSHPPFITALVPQANPLTPCRGPTHSERYIRKLDVINRGFAGYNTSMVLPIARDLFGPGGADVAFWTLWLGANDAGEGQTISVS